MKVSAPFTCIILGLLISACTDSSSSLLGCIEKNKNPSANNIIAPTTIHIPEEINSFTPKRVSDLTEIVIALEKYKRTNRSYPISSKAGQQWDRYFTHSNEIRPVWIKGLAPEFIEVLPRDPRMNQNYKHQYAYKSNGANYKLIAFYPEDCDFVKSKLPHLIDPIRDCRAYGFWTAGASNW